jgi:Type III secretion protein (HpaP)
MNSSSRYIDFGPAALPVGAPAVQPHCLQADKERLNDALRLRAVLDVSRDMSHALYQDAAQAAPMPLPDGSQAQLPEDDSDRLGEEIERIWVNDGAHGLREVRIRLADAILPGTWIRISNQAGELLIEISAAHEGTRHWLGRVAPQLADDLCQRLRQSVRISVDGPDLPEPSGVLGPRENGGHS